MHLEHPFSDSLDFKMVVISGGRAPIALGLLAKKESSSWPSVRCVIKNCQGWRRAFKAKSGHSRALHTIPFFSPSVYVGHSWAPPPPSVSYALSDPLLHLLPPTFKT
ncbi:hypothetical protein AVEN_69663-1 [Araneus ventricosus]|uniref:Uncharacterized protein n=1 Tax=Araneus ventricosus TaxID=182803 RepID=A0A4Y2HUR3_ARAVE|nr:hypothetical protein AVEN_69663-1 [Araneus ventricosus]